MSDRKRRQNRSQANIALSSPHPLPAVIGNPTQHLASCLDWLNEAATILSTRCESHDRYDFYLTELPLVVKDARECLAAISPGSYQAMSSNDND